MPGRGTSWQWEARNRDRTNYAGCIVHWETKIGCLNLITEERIYSSSVDVQKMFND